MDGGFASCEVLLGERWIEVTGHQDGRVAGDGGQIGEAPGFSVTLYVLFSIW